MTLRAKEFGPIIALEPPDYLLKSLDVYSSLRAQNAPDSGCGSSRDGSQCWNSTPETLSGSRNRSRRGFLGMAAVKGWSRQMGERLCGSGSRGRANTAWGWGGKEGEGKKGERGKEKAEGGRQRERKEGNERKEREGKKKKERKKERERKGREGKGGMKRKGKEDQPNKPALFPCSGKGSYM